MNNLYYYVDKDARYVTQITQMVFPGGEVGVNINTGATVDASVKDVSLFAHIQSSNDVMAMLLATEALRYAYPSADIHLGLPYIPYARQDRRCNPGEALSLKVFADLVNSQNYKIVVAVDPHSNVSHMIDRLHIVSQYELFASTKLSWHDVTIMAPDLGAVKKCEEFAKKVGAKQVVVCNKKRELSTGKITGLEIIGNPDLKNQHIVVLDDICDGGRTFVELLAAIEAYEPNTDLIELYVPHGIFSKGIEVLKGYDTVVTTNTFHPNMKDQGNVEVIDFND